MKVQYKKVSVKDIKPDPNQPRKVFNEEAIEALATSIKNEGVINAIEVDEKYIIITGEQRWRASIKAGLKEIPIKIIENVTKEDRFIRQVHENIHQNTMSPLETAEALEKIRKIIVGKTKTLRKGRWGDYSYNIPGLLELNGLFGLTTASIYNYLTLLGEKGEMKEALKTKGFQVDKVLSVNMTPEKYRKQMTHLVVTQKELPRETVRQLKNTLVRAAKYGEDEKAKELFKHNYEKLTVVDAVRKMNRIVPDEESRIKEPSDAANIINEKVMELLEILEKHPLDSLDPMNAGFVNKDLNALGFFASQYLKGKMVEGRKSNFLLTKGK